jgi:hypothetical protein
MFFERIKDVFDGVIGIYEFLYTTKYRVRLR